MNGMSHADSDHTRRNLWERCLNDTVRTLRKKVFGLWQQRHAPRGWTMLRCVQHESDHGPIRYDTRQGLHGGDRMTTRVRIHVGCPSGTTEDWSKSTEILIPVELLEHFSARIITYAEEKGRDYRRVLE